ncbi:MAG: aminopeptidase [Candidatus Hecatellaceae archaeon]
MTGELTEREMAEIAGKLVRESLRIGRKPSGGFEAVRIMYNSTDSTCVEFALKVEEECWKTGAHTIILPYSSARQKTRFTVTPEEALAQMNPLAEALAKTIDVSIFIGEEDDPGWSGNLADRVKLQAPHKQKLREILDERKVRWAYVGWPIPGAARGYECPLEKFRQIFFDSIRQSFTNEVRRLCEYYRQALEGVDQVTVKAEDGTNLTFSIKGRPILVDDAYISEEDVKRGDVGLNIPTGEVFVAPIEDSANGTISFEKVAIPGFGRILGLKLTFRDGRVVEYEASEGREVFTRFLEANTGDKDRIAELGIGCNPGAQYTGGSIIVDEKIYGTVHIAIGSNTGAYHGRNKASSHLDMIKDMGEGVLLADGNPVMQNGKPLKL